MIQVHKLVCEKYSWPLLDWKAGKTTLSLWFVSVHMFSRHSLIQPFSRTKEMFVTRCFTRLLWQQTPWLCNSDDAMYCALARMTGGVWDKHLPLSIGNVLQELPIVHNNLFTRYQACLRVERNHFKHPLLRCFKLQTTKCDDIAYRAMGFSSPVNSLYTGVLISP
jgi:hypothetical protein